MKRDFSVRPRAFTLVELLVVIGIIALLISILLPSLNSARESALKVTCASNQRQIYIAFVSYAIDNRNWINPVYAPGPNPSTGADAPDRPWHERFSPVSEHITANYLPWSKDYFRRGVYLCPSESREMDDPFFQATAYAMNVWIGGYVGTAYLPHRFNELSASHDQVILLSENNRPGIVGTSGYGLPVQDPPMDVFRHDRAGSINLLYADGVVRLLRKTEVFGDVPLTIEMTTLMNVGRKY